MEEGIRVGCVVLAAGSARRYGSNKLQAGLAGRSLILRTLEAVPAGRLADVVVVTQYPEIMRLAGEFHFAALCNDQPQLGLSHSIALGLTQLRDCQGAIFMVSDQPLLRRESVERLLDAWLAQPQKIAALGHGGVRGNPCLFPARYFPQLLALEGDQGGSAVIARHPEDLLVVETDPRELLDVDTRQALEALEGQ